MEIAVSSVTNEEDELKMLRLRKEAFENEQGLMVDSLNNISQREARHLPVHAEPSREAIDGAVETLPLTLDFDVGLIGAMGAVRQSHWNFGEFCANCSRGSRSS